MIRNRGPISTLGYNLTSRDLPTDEGESEGPSPNSGAIAKALNGHPVMRFFASAATALVATHVASKFVSAGGNLLQKYKEHLIQVANMPEHLLDSLRALAR
jgi:hypothetical protein